MITTDENTETSVDPITSHTPLQGFARLSPEARKLAAKIGGQAAQRSPHAHRWTKEQARIAGRKGGLVSQSRAIQRQREAIGSTPGREDSGEVSQ